MVNTPHVTDIRNAPNSPIVAGHGARQRAAFPPNERPAANAWRGRSYRTIGFWLGGIILGAGGCLWGASMPYHHSVGVAVSMLWWGIYWACLGASLGALLGLWAESRRHVRARRST